jgi:hypothetical protein
VWRHLVCFSGLACDAIIVKVLLHPGRRASNPDHGQHSVRITMSASAGRVMLKPFVKLQAVNRKIDHEEIDSCS